MSRTGPRSRVATSPVSPPETQQISTDPSLLPTPKEPTKGELWFGAIKPPMYTVAITPILAGSFASFTDTQRLDVPKLMMFLFAAIAIIMWLNLTNDVFDFDTGVDENKRESIVNLCGGTRTARHCILAVSCIFLAAGFVSLWSLSHFALGFDSTILFIMMIAVFAGYAYQGPPFRLSYVGLGEPICFIAWGLTVCAAYYSQHAADRETHSALLSQYPRLSQRVGYLFVKLLFSTKLTLLSAALLVATATTLILFCSHFHQRDDDSQAGKLSPIVRLGTTLASHVLWILLFFFTGTHVVLLALGTFPWQAFCLTLFSFRHLWALGMFVHRYHKYPPIVRPAKYYAVKFHFIHGILMSLGFFIAGKTTSHL